MSAPTRPSLLHDFFLLFLLFCGGAGEAEVPPPQNVTMVTLNTHYVLSWEWEPSAAESHAVTFTMQYVGRHELKYKKNPKWITVCNQTAARSCDLTPFNLHYLGIFALRVRASVDGRHSDWEQLEFCPDKEAALGPPSSVALAPAGSDLDVVVTNPLSSQNTSMKLLVPDLYYRLEYWERPADGQASAHKLLRINTTMVTLPDLKAWTWYCVMVQTRYDYYGKFSDFTAPHCMQTEGPIPWWKIFLYFLGSLLFFFLFVLVVFYGSFRCCKTIKDYLNPSDQLPPHLKKYLCSAPSSDTPRLLTPDSESELLCKGVTVCPLPAVLEIHISPPEGLSAPPEGLDPNSRHSRQDSSSSGDSGVYSSGGSSAPQQLAYAGSEDGFKGSFDPERVNLLEMAAGLKSRPVVVDEGVVDVCV